MTITVNSKGYESDSSPNANTEVYRGPAATAVLKDQLLLARTPPKPTASFPGVARSRYKFTKSYEYATGIYADAIIEVNISFVAGTAEASIDSMRDDAGDFLLSATYGGGLAYDHDIKM